MNSKAIYKHFITKLKTNNSDDEAVRLVYLCMLVLLACGMLLYLSIRFTGYPVLSCAVADRTGLYCPGCGASRAVFALLSGHPVRALWYHPFVVYAAGVGAWFIGRHTLHVLMPARISDVRYQNRVMWLGIILLIGQWLVKLACLFAGIRLI